MFFTFFGVNRFVAGDCLEFMRKPTLQRDYLAYIEQTIGLKLSPP